MLYKRFNIQDEDQINEFLKKYDQQIPENGGIRVVGDSVCILYSELDDEDYAKQSVIAALKTSIMKFKMELAEHKQKEQFFRDGAIRVEPETGKKYSELVVHHCNEQKRCLTEIHFYKEVIHLIEAGDFNLEQ